MCQRRWRGSAATFRAGPQIPAVDDHIRADRLVLANLTKPFPPINGQPLNSMCVSGPPPTASIALSQTCFQKSRVELVSVAWNVDRSIQRQPFAQATGQCRDINAFRGKQQNPRQRHDGGRPARTKGATPEICAKRRDPYSCQSRYLRKNANTD
jgi:hypothetical protein